MSSSRRTGKGSFGRARLPLVGRCPVPSTARRRLVLGGLAAAGVLALALFLPTLFGERRALAPGPLSSAHAGQAASCSSCHAGGLAGVPDHGCLSCHERAGVAQGSFALARHAAYRSGQSRPVPPGSDLTCANCHVEHGGRDAAVTAVDDAVCADCHGFRSFLDGHPEFDFVAHELPDATALQFSHRHHVARVLAERLPPAAAAANPQLACLSCHRPDPAGAGFAPLEFERHCGSCHLTGAEQTPSLPLFDRARPRVPGLLGLDELAARDSDRWALFTDPAELTVRGGAIEKGPLNHADPWVLANLRHIRATLYPREGLAAALDVRPAGEPDGAAGAELFGRALTGLRGRAALLRGRAEPGLDQEVRRIEEAIRVAETRLGAGESASAAGLLDPGPPNAALSPADAAAWRELAVELTTPCRQCHVVADGALLAVDSRQGPLQRAEFHHRAHYAAQPDCRACHGAIPDLLGTNRLADGTFPPAPADTAATQNVPAIAVCRQCHGDGRSAARCTDCHRFHPDTRFRPDRLLVLSAGEEP